MQYNNLPSGSNAINVSCPTTFGVSNHAISTKELIDWAPISPFLHSNTGSNWYCPLVVRTALLTNWLVESNKYTLLPRARILDILALVWRPSKVIGSTSTRSTRSITSRNPIAAVSSASTSGWLLRISCANLLHNNTWRQCGAAWIASLEALPKVASIRAWSI